MQYLSFWLSVMLFIAAIAGDCLDIAAALAINMPGHVLVELSATRLLVPLQPGPLLADYQSCSDSLLEADIPGLQHLQQTTEAAAGSFPITMGFTTMLHALLVTGMCDSTLQVRLCSHLPVRPCSDSLSAAFNPTMMPA